MFFRKAAIAATIAAAVAATSNAQHAQRVYGQDGANADLKLEVIVSRGVADLRVRGGMVGAPVQILIGFQAADLSLEKIGVDASVVLVPSFTTTAGKFDAGGSHWAGLDLFSVDTKGAHIFMQAVSMNRMGLTLSHGLEVKFEYESNENSGLFDVEIVKPAGTAKPDRAADEKPVQTQPGISKPRRTTARPSPGAAPTQPGVDNTGSTDAGGGRHGDKPMDGFGGGQPGLTKPGQETEPAKPDDDQAGNDQEDENKPGPWKPIDVGDAQAQPWQKK